MRGAARRSSHMKHLEHAGFRVWGLGFRGLGFGARRCEQGRKMHCISSKMRVQGLRFKNRDFSERE